MVVFLSLAQGMQTGVHPILQSAHGNKTRAWRGFQGQEKEGSLLCRQRPVNKPGLFRRLDYMWSQGDKAMTVNSVVRARVDERTKREAAAALKKSGSPYPMPSACCWCA
jgi:hypothetical protein